MLLEESTILKSWHVVICVLMVLFLNLVPQKWDVGLKKVRNTGEGGYMYTVAVDGDALSSKHC